MCIHTQKCYYCTCSLQAPLIITASNDLDSSVMIASVREFHNPNRRGATMRMNTEGVDFVSILKHRSSKLYNYACYACAHIMYKF